MVSKLACGEVRPTGPTCVALRVALGSARAESETTEKQNTRRARVDESPKACPQGGADLREGRVSEHRLFGNLEELFHVSMVRHGDLGQHRVQVGMCKALSGTGRGRRRC